MLQQLGPHNTKHTHEPEYQIPHNKHFHQTSPRCLAHYTTGHPGQLNTHYHLTTYPSSLQSTYDMNTDCNKTDEHSQTTRKPTGHNIPKTQEFAFPRPQYPPTYTLPIESSKT